MVCLIVFCFNFVQTFATIFAQSYCSTPFVQHVILLLLFDLLFCSSCSMCYSAPLIQPICFVPLTWHWCSFYSTYLFYSSYLTLVLLLFDLLLCYSCLNYCSTPFARRCYPSCSTLMFFSFCLMLLLLVRSCTYLLHLWFCYSLFLLFDTTTFAPLVST